MVVGPNGVGAAASARQIWQHRGVDVEVFNALSPAAADRVLGEVCAAPQWIEAVRAGRPYPSVDDLLAAGGRASGALDDAALAAALAGHPRIGAQRATAATDGAPSAAFAMNQSSATSSAAREQAGVDVADADLHAQLAEANRAYEQRFGRIYLVCAAGRTGHQLLTILRQRLGNDDATELAVTRAELTKINRLRLERMVAPSAS